MMVKNNLKDGKWKNSDEKYLKEIQTFLDKAENIKNEELRKEVIFQMLKCDKELTILSEKIFKECYEEGYNQGIKE